MITIAGFALIILFEAFMFLVAVGQVLDPGSTADLDGETVSVWIMVQSVLAILSIPINVATIIVFLIWLNRSYKNLHALRPAHLEFSSGWAVGYWFIPIISLFRPFQVVREVWTESDPEVTDGATFLSQVTRSAPTYMAVWWIFWIGSNVANRFASYAYDAQRAEDVYVGGVAILVASAMTITAAVLVSMVVRDITSRQMARHAAVSELAERERADAAFPGRFDDDEGWRSNG